MSQTMKDKFLESVWITLIARATIIAIGPLMAFLLWIGAQVYDTFTASQAIMSQQINEMQRELQDHEARLNNGKTSRLEFQGRTDAQFAKLDTQLSFIANKIAAVSDSVIRVQTIIETRLPTKASNLAPQQNWSIE